MKQDQNKLFKLDSNVGIVVCGEAGDTVYFGEFIQKNIALYRIKNGYSLSVKSVANFTRNELADSLRRRPYQVNLLLGGYDSSESKSLPLLDGLFRHVRYSTLRCSRVWL